MDFNNNFENKKIDFNNNFSDIKIDFSDKKIDFSDNFSDIKIYFNNNFSDITVSLFTGIGNNINVYIVEVPNETTPSIQVFAKPPA